MSTGTSTSQPTPLDSQQTRRLSEAVSGLDAMQLQWMSGYTAGLAVVGQASPAPAVDPGNALTVLYGSQTGNGESIAKKLAEQAREKGFAVNLVSLADYKPANLKRETLVSFVVSTHGEGDPPDDAELFHEFLFSKKAPKLAGLKYSVLALGDSSYIKFCETGREFDARLAELGAERLAPVMECDLDYEASAATWSQDIVEGLPKLINAGAAVPRLRAVDSVARFTKQNPYPAEVLANQKITGGNSSKDVRHIELSLEGSGLCYEPGDALAVVVPNPPKLVDQLLAALSLRADEAVSLNGKQSRLDQALKQDVEITALNLGFLRSWAVASAAEELVDLLAANNHSESQQALADFVDTHQIIDIVRQFPANVTAQDFVSSLRKLSPRSYSIASSLTANPDEVHLTVAAVRYDAFGSEHWGAASTHLADRLDEGDTVPVYIEQNSRFRLPDNDDAPIIMIGPGTGVAPFRAFVEERAERSATGGNWLFFGDRRFSDDFLYQLEWQRHLKNARLDKLDVAFSRDQEEKIYVQDCLRERATELFAWLERGAYIYVCGDSKNMAGDVNDALIDIIAEQAGLDRAAAEQRLKELRRAGRYQRDVY